MNLLLSVKDHGTCEDFSIGHDTLTPVVTPVVRVQTSVIPRYLSLSPVILTHLSLTILKGACA